MWKPVDFTPTPIEKYLASHRKKSLGLPDQVFDDIAAKMINEKDTVKFEEYLDKKLEAGYPINYKRGGRETLLHYALKMYVQPKIVYALIKRGSDVNITNYRGQNALQSAAKQIDWWSTDMGVYSAIIKDIKDLDAKDKYGVSVINHLVYAYIYDNNEYTAEILDLLHMILRAGADINKCKGCLKLRCYNPVEKQRKQELLNFFSQYEVLHDASTENFFEYAL